MTRIMKVTLLSALLLFVMGSVVLAAASVDLAATKTATGQTTLVWTFQTNDGIEVSTDGITWTAVTLLTTPIKVNAGDAVDGNTMVVGLTDYVNYYFRVVNAATYSNVVDAFPPNEHAHKYFAADTSRCASCHATHTAVGARLLKTATVDDTCATCHVTGTGSKYQVDAGTMTGPSATTLSALAGFFGTTLTGGTGGTPTSAHNMSAVLNTAPGGLSGGTGLWADALGCGSCHTAHTDKSYQYRLLKKVGLPNYLAGVGGAATTTLTVAAGDFTVDAYAVTDQVKLTETAYYKNSSINNFCGGCHADYNTGKNAGSSGSGASGVFNQTYYRHAVDKEISTYTGGALTTTLPLTPTGAAFISDGSSHAAGKVNCITCHFPHGTSKVVDGTSKLLRMDQRGVCEDCHKK